MDWLIAFLQDRWMMVLGVIVLLALVIRLIKTAVKWVLVLALIAGMGYYAYQYADELKTLGNGVVSEAKEEIVRMLAEKVTDASYRENPDGTFTVTAKDIVVEGKQDSDEVTITFKGQTLTLSMNEAIRSFLDAAKNRKDNEMGGEGNASVAE